MSKKLQKKTKAASQTETGFELLSGQRQSSESDSAVIACNDWLRMGSGRSLPALLEKYADLNQNIPPTASYATLKVWSMQYAWAERAREYDATWEARKNAEREAVLNYGLSLDYERLRKLNRLAALLETQIYERGETGILHNLWMPDVKAIGSGEFAERVDIERFNAPLLEQYRKVLDDIAKETGGRVSQVKIDDWRSQAIKDIRDKKINFQVLAQAFDEDLANELFRLAGVPIE